jgi:N-methylhydantoinase A
MAIRIGIDTGGTFTDLVGIDETSGQIFLAKQPSTPHDPALAVIAALQEAGADLQHLAAIIVGTTVATNAVIERKGAKILYVTTEGFRDIPFIQRLDKKELYDLHWEKPRPLVKRANCLEVRERVGHNGEVIQALQPHSLDTLRQAVAARQRQDAVEAVAVCLLFSYLYPVHEQQIRQTLEAAFPDLSVSVSSEVCPTWRDFERASTTLADVYVKPIARSYVQSVATGLRKLDITAPWNVMKSNGGLMIAAKAADHPADMLLSGLAGGVIGGKYFGELAGLADLFTLDMGGTSCDIGVIQAGQQLYAAEFDLDWGLPVTIPCVDVKTIGAGGGSIVFIDKGGFLQVGPHSAGADPGPAAYDRGGTQATLTDANLVLGGLNPDYFLGGKMKLNRARAVEALSPVAAHMGRSLEEVAQAAVDTANENMANAIRLIAVEKGFDPREFTLVAFGGAGSLHASAIARAAQIPRVLVPLHPGLCSAFGALIADWRVDKLWTHYRRSDQMTPAAIETAFQRLSHEALTELAAEGFQGTPLILRSIDMRYAGQNYEQAVPIPDGPITAETIQHVLQRFADLHEAFYGFCVQLTVF